MPYYVYTDARGPCGFDWILELNTLTSKNSFSNLPPQKRLFGYFLAHPSTFLSTEIEFISIG